MDTARIATRFVVLPPYRGIEQSNRGNHPQQLRVTCGEKKEKRKLVKGLEKNLALFANMRFGIDQNIGLAGSVQESIITEAAEVLMRQLRCVQEADEKKRRKQENKKHKRKTTRMHTELIDNESTTISASSTPFEDSQCLSTAAEAVARVLRQSLEDHTDEQHKQPPPDLTSQKQNLQKKVEICMGGKCRNSGASQLLERIQSLAAKEENVNVVECKCLGKCKTSPNIRLSSSNVPPAVCSNVRISDVDSLISDFLEL